MENNMKRGGDVIYWVACVERVDVVALRHHDMLCGRAVFV